MQRQLGPSWLHHCAPCHRARAARTQLASRPDGLGRFDNSICAPSVTARNELGSAVASGEVRDRPHARRNQVGTRHSEDGKQVLFAIQDLSACTRSSFERCAYVVLPLGARGEQVAVTNLLGDRDASSGLASRPAHQALLRTGGDQRPVLGVKAPRRQSSGSPG